MEVSKEIEKRSNEEEAPLDGIRREYLSKLSEKRGRNVIAYYSGWLRDDFNVSAVALSDADMNGFMGSVRGLKRKKGLDLILHTPGGDLAAAESIIKYLRSCFGNDVVAIVPQLAMSAGTMIACSCKEIVMGRQSSIGPTDPQLSGVPASGVVEEFEQAVKAIKEEPESVELWTQIIGKYHPTFLGDCQKAIEASLGIVRDCLARNMFADNRDPRKRAREVAAKLSDHSASAMHNRHFSIDEAIAMGLKVGKLEDDDEFQDLVLTIHHAYISTFSQSSAAKIIENHQGVRWIQTVRM
ncbi:MAG: hypothetical protein LBL23_03885 [Coriobacteriales bacterium]|nr:hypothetical protein [Coriobacteriales bacterium]